MEYKLHFLLSSLTCLALYLLYRSITFHLTRRRILQLHQCLPPVKYPLIPFLFGLDIFLTSLRAVKSKTYLQRIQQLYNDYGNTFTLQSSYFSPPLIYTIEIANIKTILATKFADYTAGASRRKSFAPLLGRSIFLSDGEEWAHSRALLRPSFARNQINDMPRFEKHVKNLVRAIPVDGTTCVDLAELFLRFSADVITDFMFGESILSLSHPESFDTRFITMFQAAQDGGEARFRMGMFADLVPGQGRFWESVKWVHEFMDKHVDEALKFRQNAVQQVSLPADNYENKDERRYIFLQEIARLSDDRRVLRDELLTILFAGRDSTAATLTNLFFELSRRRHIWQCLRQEVAKKLGGTPPSFSQLKEMKYLHKCVNESKSFPFNLFMPFVLPKLFLVSSMDIYDIIALRIGHNAIVLLLTLCLYPALRLYPVIPMNSRVAQRDTILPVGGGQDGKSPIFVPEGSVVAYHAYAVQRRPDLWGKDAAEFNPERWDNEGKSSVESVCIDLCLC